MGLANPDRRPACRTECRPVTPPELHAARLRRCGLRCARPALRRHALLLVVTLGLAAPAASAGAQEAELTDLASLLEAAEANSPSLSSRRHAIDAAEARLQEALYSPFFQWNVDAGVALSPEARGTPIFSPDSQLPLSNRWRPVGRVMLRGVIPLYTFGKIQGAWRAARAGRRAAEFSEAQALAKLRFDVRRAYFGLQLALDTQQMLQEGMRYLERARVKLNEMLEDDDPDADPLDLRRLAASLAETQARVSETTRLRASSDAALRALTGLEVLRVPDCPMQPVEFSDRTLQQYRAAAAGRPELGMLEAAIDARRANVRIQEAAFGPSFGLGFQAGISYGPGITDQQNPFVQDGANSPALGAGLFLRWNIDFVGNTFRVRRARSELAMTEAQAAEAQMGIDLEVELALERYRDAKRREQVWRGGAREGRAWLIEAAQANDLGTVEPRDLVDALRAYFTNRFSHLQAVMELNVAAAELERVSAAEIGLDRWESSCE